MNKKEIIELLSLKDYTALIEKADETRKQYKGDGVHLRGLIEFSNICKRNCAYCGLQAQNKNIKRYRLNEDEIIALGKKGAELGYKTVVLQSGEDDYFNRERICKILKGLKEFDLAVTLSIGERLKDDYKAFKDFGADRYLLRIETTDENLYKKLHPNMDFKNRVKCLHILKELGYETGTGSLVGLLGQTVSSLADDILFYKELNADMVGIGPFIPHPDTPLRGELNKENFDYAIKMMAITRILMPDINIPATTAMETINPKGRILALQSGANVVMPNITTTEYRKHYEIYPNKICLNDSSDKCRNCIEGKIKSIGRYVSQNKGFRND